MKIVSLIEGAVCRFACLLAFLPENKLAESNRMICPFHQPSGWPEWHSLFFLATRQAMKWKTASSVYWMADVDKWVGNPIFSRTYSTLVI